MARSLSMSAVAALLLSAAPAPAQERLDPGDSLAQQNRDRAVKDAEAGNDWLKCDGYYAPPGAVTKGLRILLAPLAWTSPYQIQPPPEAAARARGAEGVAACDRALAHPAADNVWQRQMLLNHARALHLFEAERYAEVPAATAAARAAVGDRTSDPYFARGSGLWLDMLDAAAALAAGDRAAAARLAEIAERRPYAAVVQQAALVALNRPEIDQATRAPAEARLLALRPDARLYLGWLADARGDTAAMARQLAGYATELSPLPATLERPLLGVIDQSLFRSRFGQTLLRASAAQVASGGYARAGDTAGAERMRDQASALIADARAQAAEQEDPGRRTAMLGGVDRLEARARQADLIEALATPAGSWADRLVPMLWQDIHFPQVERPGNSFSKKGFGFPGGHDGKADKNAPLHWASFHGNATPPLTVQEMALLRAANDAAALGRDRIVLLHARDLVEQTTMTQAMTGTATNTGISGYVTQLVYVPFDSSAALPAEPGMWVERAPHALDVTAIRAALGPLFEKPAARN